MKSPPVFRQTVIIQEKLRDIDILKSAFALVSITSQVTHNIRRASLLKSSLFSARIEGNPLKLEDVTYTSRPSSSIKKREVSNILRALNYIAKEPSPKISEVYLKKLHAITLDNLSPDAGHFRTEVSAIFNSAGVAIYMTPPPLSIPQLLTSWCNWCNTTKEPGPIRAILAHFWFEKIHPFLDGNGRVGRLIMSWILIQTGYDFGGMISFEEYLDQHRQMYYDELNTSGYDITTFVEFFLTGFVKQTKKALDQIKYPTLQTQSNLLPRRQEIVDIIRDHTQVSFDFLWRRFRAVPKSTLHNDLQQLIKGDHIKKLGTTKGVVYTVGMNE